MNLKSRLSLLLLVVGVVNTALALTINHWKLSPEGFGPLQIGMTLKDAAKIKGIRLSGNKPEAYENTGCYYETLKGVKDLSLMISQGKIVRINISSPHFYTSKGAHVGDSESKVKALYHGKLDVEPHRYEEKGHYLTFVVEKPQKRAIRFETDGKRITRIYAGQDPEVYYVEDCL